MSKTKQTPASDSIMNKIAKLLKSKESFEKMGSINEAEIFAAKIQTLLDAHNLSLGDITLEERMEEFVEEKMNHMIPSVGGTTAHDIMRAIAKHNYCRVYILTAGKNGKMRGMQIIGTAENIEVCKYIYNAVKPIFMSVGKEKFNEAKEKGLFDKGLDTYLRAFLVGCAKGLDKKLASEKEVQIQANEQLNGLVKVNDAALKQYVAQSLGEINKMKARGISDGGAFHQGIKTGSGVKISKGLENKSKPVSRKLLN